MRIAILLLAFLFAQIPAFSVSNLDLEAGNPVQLISHTSQYARITGKIESIDISERSKVIFLNFGKSYNTSFTAVIYDDSVSSFVLAGINEPAEFFKDKTVTMEGIIRISNGKPEMVIDSPEQIKVVNNEIKK